MTKGRRITLLEKYIRLLEKEARRTHSIVFAHGYTCDDDDYKEGERLRAALKWEAHEERREKLEQDKGDCFDKT